MEKQIPELLAAMADADVVLIHWWNNPGSIGCLSILLSRRAG